MANKRRHRFGVARLGHGLQPDPVQGPGDRPRFGRKPVDGGPGKETGKEVWRYKDNGFTGTWGTPVLVDCGQGRTDLVIAVPYKIWGLDPATGKLRWHCDGLDSDSICTSAIADDGVVYVLETGPRGGGTIAVRAGGEGDVSKTHIVWRGTERTRIATPVLAGERIYIVNSRAANCLDAATGQAVSQTSPTGGPPAAGAASAAATGRPAAGAARAGCARGGGRQGRVAAVG